MHAVARRAPCGLDPQQKKKCRLEPGRSPLHLYMAGLPARLRQRYDNIARDQQFTSLLFHVMCVAKCVMPPEDEVILWKYSEERLHAPEWCCIHHPRTVKVFNGRSGS